MYPAAKKQTSILEFILPGFNTIRPGLPILTNQKSFLMTHGDSHTSFEHCSHDIYSLEILRHLLFPWQRRGSTNVAHAARCERLKTWCKIWHNWSWESHGKSLLTVQHQNDERAEDLNWICNWTWLTLGWQQWACVMRLCLNWHFDIVDMFSRAILSSITRHKYGICFFILNVTW